jgi:hypothetical protein
MELVKLERGKEAMTRAFVRGLAIRGGFAMKWRDIDQGVRNILLKEIESFASFYSPSELGKLLFG